MRSPCPLARTLLSCSKISRSGPTTNVCWIGNGPQLLPAHLISGSVGLASTTNGIRSSGGYTICTHLSTHPTWSLGLRMTTFPSVTKLKPPTSSSPVSHTTQDSNSNLLFPQAASHRTVRSTPLNTFPYLTSAFFSSNGKIPFGVRRECT